MAVIVRRLTKRAEFIEAKDKGTRESHQAFVLQWLEKAEEKGLGVGFTTSSKAIGNAVMRNRARRRLKAAFDGVCRLNKEAQGVGKILVFVAKLPVLKIDYNYLVKDITKALQAAGVTC